MQQINDKHGVIGRAESRLVSNEDEERRGFRRRVDNVVDSHTVICAVIDVLKVRTKSTLFVLKVHRSTRFPDKGPPRLIGRRIAVGAHQQRIIRLRKRIPQSQQNPPWREFFSS